MNVVRAARWLLAVAFVALAPGAVSAQARSLTVGVSTETGEPWLRIGPVLDDRELEEAVRGGLPLRLRVRVELWRDGWIDDLVGTESWSTVVVFDPLDRQYIVRPRTNARARFFSTWSTSRAAIEAEYRLQLRASRPGRYYYSAVLDIETLSVSDLEELERWLQGELQPAVTGDRSITGAIGTGARRLLIRLLGLPSRREEARSRPFRIGEG